MMGTVAQKVLIKVKEFNLEGYLVKIDNNDRLLFTHRQIGEIVGKSKATAQNYLKKNAGELPSPIKTKIPDRRGEIPLTLPEAAIAYWHYQDLSGNHLASSLLDALDNKPLEEFVIVSTTDEIVHFTSVKDQNSNNLEIQAENGNTSIKLLAESIEVSAQWMIEAGVDPAAIAHWKLSELQKHLPALKNVVGSAQELLAAYTNTPTGMIASQLAEILSSKLERKITAAQVNKILHELGFLDWANPDKNRERKLTEAGKKYGVAILTTSADGWQGAQIRWFDNVIPILFQEFSDFFRKSC